MNSLRESTLRPLGIGSALEFFINGQMPVTAKGLVERVFGPENDRGALVISGGNGIVGSGKAMQLGSRLLEFGVPIVTLDLPDAPNGLKGQFGGVIRSFGAELGGQIASNIVQFTYDGKHLPTGLNRFKPRFVLEAIPENLQLKRAHYAMWRAAYPDVEIRSVTSGFPSRELGVGILHPSFPHQINKVWEVVEESPSDITRLLWALGLVPIGVGDYWSFILDVLFCGVTLAALRYHRASNIPYWKLDKYVRRLLGPNPIRAHDAIGPGASYLTWSCLHHLEKEYGAVFRPTPDLERRMATGEMWYSSNRPIVDWEMSDEREFRAWLLGPLFQMTGILLKEERASLSAMNAIGELCAQFTRGVNSLTRSMGADKIRRVVGDYHKLHPKAKERAWYGDVYDNMATAEWRQLYVNAEHSGGVGLVTISRESLNWDVIMELNGAIDWLKSEKVKRVIVSYDFHLATQLIGADTQEFYEALKDDNLGYTLALEWSKTARRLYEEFEVSVGFIGGKRCLGGMLELMMHCHFLVAVEGVQIGMPEVTLPVVPGMEGCHLPFRRAEEGKWANILKMLLTGQAMDAKTGEGWIIDFAGSLEDALKTAWSMAKGKGNYSFRRVSDKAFNSSKIAKIRQIAGSFDFAKNESERQIRQALVECICNSLATPLSKAIEIQAKCSADFMTGKWCNDGAIGTAARRIMDV